MEYQHPIQDDRPPERPYMPTPEQYATSLPGREPARPARPNPRRRGPVWPRVLAILVILLVVAVVGYAGFIGFSLSKISTQPLALSGLTGDASGRVNVLVLGVGDPGHDGENLTDTLMVISIDTRSNRVAQISIPRDLRVDIPEHGTGKINSANVYGGVKTAEQTVSDTLGIPIHYYVKTNFSGLRSLVDAVGGIDVNVKERLTDPEYPCDDNQYKSCGLDILPGQQHMDGTKALQYVRCRKGTCGNDFGRAARQQEVINLVRDKVARADVILNPAKLTPIISAVRTGVETDMGAIQMLEFANDWHSAQKNPSVKLVLSNGPGGLLKGANGSSDLLPIGGDFSRIQDKAANIFSSQ